MSAMWAAHRPRLCSVFFRLSCTSFSRARATVFSRCNFSSSWVRPTRLSVHHCMNLNTSIISWQMVWMTRSMITTSIYKNILDTSERGEHPSILNIVSKLNTHFLLRSLRAVSALAIFSWLSSSCRFRDCSKSDLTNCALISSINLSVKASNHPKFWAV